MKELKELISLLLLGLLWNCNLGAQNPSCDGVRFSHTVFDSVIVSSDIIYGQNTTVVGTLIDLKMDIYEPWQDTSTLRPVIFIVHGGGFTSGSKSDEHFVGLSKDYAQKGYLVVSIDYRLYDLTHTPDSFLLKDAVVRGMGDLKAAMRYLVEDAVVEKQYKADTANLYLCGASAGALIANTTAYLDDLDEAEDQIKQLIISHGGLQGNSSTNTHYYPRVKGILNCSGGLFDPSCIDEMDPALISIHCPNDPKMPYKKGWLVMNGDSVIEANGSYLLHQKAEMEGLTCELIDVPGVIHMQYYADSVYYDSMMLTSSFMFENIICVDSGGIVPVATAEPTQLMSSYFYPNPADKFINIKNIKSGELEIYTLTVMLVRKETIKGPVINIQDLTPGMYFLIIKVGQSVYKQKLIVSR